MGLHATPAPLKIRHPFGSSTLLSGLLARIARIGAAEAGRIIEPVREQRAAVPCRCRATGRVGRRQRPVPSVLGSGFTRRCTAGRRVGTLVLGARLRRTTRRRAPISRRFGRSGRIGARWIRGRRPRRRGWGRRRGPIRGGRQRRHDLALGVRRQAPCGRSEATLLLGRGFATGLRVGDAAFRIDAPEDVRLSDRGLGDRRQEKGADEPRCALSAFSEDARHPQGTGPVSGLACAATPSGIE